MTTANRITIVRMALIPVFLVLAYAGLRWAALAVKAACPAGPLPSCCSGSLA